MVLVENGADKFMIFPACAEYSRQINEPLIGTIGQAHVYFLIEYKQVFGAKALNDSTIPPEVFKHLAGIPNSNTVLMRQPATTSDLNYTYTFFAVNVLTQHIYELTLHGYRDLLEVNLEALLNEQVITPRTQPIYAICTNGKRDQCCSGYGVPIYNALREIVGNQVWQVSHIGGHRFAGTGIMFPQAVSYGYLDQADVPTLVEHVQNNTLWLDKLRGELRYSTPEQVASWALYHHLKVHHANAFTHIHTLQEAEMWEVVFEYDGQQYAIRVEQGEPLKILSNTTDTTLKEIYPLIARVVEKV
jgi:hypothetical protein